MLMSLIDQEGTALPKRFIQVSPGKILNKSLSLILD